MWTFPTVRPNTLNKLQKGYTHTDSEARHTHTHQLNVHKNLCWEFFFLSWLTFISFQSGDSVKRQPKSQCLSALVTPIFREVRHRRVHDFVGPVSGRILTSEFQIWAGSDYHEFSLAGRRSNWWASPRRDWSTIREIGAFIFQILKIGLQVNQVELGLYPQMKLSPHLRCQLFLFLISSTHFALSWRRSGERAAAESAPSRSWRTPSTWQKNPVRASPTASSHTWWRECAGRASTCGISSTFCVLTWLRCLPSGFL